MEGFLASLYARQTAKDIEDIRATARRVAAHLNPGARVLEVAPGPGYLAIELAKLTGGRVQAVDISRTFVRIATENARQAGVHVDVMEGDAADLPLPDDGFDFIVCRAAFKSFSAPVRALDEMHRVLKPGGLALILDLRKDFSPEAVNNYRRRHGAIVGAVMKLSFSTTLKRRAYTRDRVAEIVARSRFKRGDIRLEPMTFELWLQK